MDETYMILIGMLNTDIFAHGISHFPKPNDPVYGGTLRIGPGGKPGNIASMAGHLLPANSVAMIGRTAEDTYGLWRQPVEGLEKAGVNTEFIRVLSPEQTDKFPSVALGGVDPQGNNLFFVLPGISDDFSPADIDDALPLFVSAGQNNGLLALTLECPLPTVLHAAHKAAEYGMKIIFDPGGVAAGQDVSELFRQKPYLVKPNEYESETLTGIEVVDFETARQAAHKLVEQGAQNVLITHGEHGAYLFNGDDELHIPIPLVDDTTNKDATGCGDQMMATICAYLHDGKSLAEAAKIAVAAGTLQFHKSGCQPVSRAELEDLL